MTLRDLTLATTALATGTVLCIAMSWSPSVGPAVDAPAGRSASTGRATPATGRAPSAPSLAPRPAPRATDDFTSRHGPTPTPSASTAPVAPPIVVAAPDRAEQREQRLEVDATAAARRVALFERNIAAVDAALARTRASGSAAYVAQLERRRALLIAQRDAEAATGPL